MKKPSLIAFPVATLVLTLILALSPPSSAQTVDWSKKTLQSERSRSYDALHYLIKIKLDLDQKAFEGATTITASSLRENLEICVLDAEEFTVTSVFSADGRPLTFAQTATALTVHLPRPFKFGEEFSFTCFYNGLDPKIGLRFMPETADNPQLVFSDSFPENVHHWFPCYDYPNDKVTDEIIATVKSGLKVAANGRLVSANEEKSTGTVTYHWSQDLPHSTYLIFLAAGPYVVVRDSYKTLPVNYWVYPRDEAKVKPTYGKTPKMIEFFNRIFGYDYPWQKYDQVSVPSGGGAESTSATAMTHRIMVDEKGEPDFSAIGIVSHELAHQWWGDLITLRSWAHTWLNESFGTYSDYLYHRYEKGDDEGAVNLQNKLNAYLREAKTRYIRPIVSDRYDMPGDMFDSHTYPKGARVLHMLRSLVGDEPFFKTLSHFLHCYAFDAVDTADFIRSVKTVTGQNLDWFFDQWLYKPGHPVFEVKSEWDAAAKVVRLKVAQVQDFSKGVPVFRVPVSIKLVAPGKTDIRKVWIKEREEMFEFPLEAKPLLVRFDEDNVLIKEIAFPKDRDELLYQLKHDDVIGRMEAAAALPAFKDDPQIAAALAASLQTDPFWAVRKSSLEALARLHSKNGPAVFKKACHDRDSQVRAAALAALGDLKDRTLLDFYKNLFQKDGSYRVQAEALTAIGKAGDPSAVPFLKQAAAVPSYRDMVRRAAETALKQLEFR
ncbi:MAG: M1 family aminopeptidase [Candidatus Aminicenantes bacterium]|nr:M1 family aminopeptidase [Candidatus Aminicenantes bacterium]